MRNLSIGLLALSFLLAGGCNKDQDRRGPAQPPAAPGRTAGGGLNGKVLEVQSAGGYTYLKLSTAQGEKWAAVQQSEVKPGQEVNIGDAMPMRNFTSKALNRKFDEIFFGTLGGGGGGGGPGMARGGNPHGGGGAPHGRPPSGRVTFDKPLAKAPGADGHTVAEVFAGAAKLKDQKAAVRGKVAKFNAGIMGKNWLHLQDGTGTADAKNFDLTVTTKDTATVGSVVIVRGTVRTNKDFGAGYSYAVIVEEASVEAEK